MFKYLLYKIGQFVVDRLPVQVSYRWASFVSDMQCVFSPRDRRAVRNNLRIILNTNAELTRETREVFRNFGGYLVDFFRLGKKLDRDFIDRYVKIENLAYINDALKSNKGAIFVSAHIGNWELGGMIISTFFPVTAVALPHKERQVNNLFNAQRQAHGITVVAPSVAVRRCMEALKANQLIALIADRDFGAHGVEMNFLGRRALIPKGPAIFSMKTGAPIIPCFFIRNADDTFSLFIEKPIFPAKVSDGTIEEEALVDLIKQYLKKVEEKIYQYPTQWLMFREFWIK